MYFFLSNLDKYLVNANDKTVENWIGPWRAIFGNVLNIIRIAGTGIALIMLTWMSINYFSANGRSAPWAAEREADVKGRQLINFAVGALVFIGAGNILWFIVQFVAQVLGDIFS